MTSCLISSFVRCSIPRVSFIYRSQFHAPFISRTLILRNLISKPCCAISIKSASSKSLANEYDKIKRTDKNLLRVVESKIAEKKGKKVWPTDFPFEIIDNPGDRSITLKREYAGEQIQATAFKRHLSGIDLIVTIYKKVGPTLKFRCVLTPDDFEIECMAMKLESSEDPDACAYQRPDLSDSEKRMQRAFYKYLAARGFKKSLYDCLHYRMYGREYFAWHSLKKFIEQ